jgi:hypothetical protein
MLNPLHETSACDRTCLFLLPRPRLYSFHALTLPDRLTLHALTVVLPPQAAFFYTGDLTFNEGFQWMGVAIMAIAGLLIPLLHFPPWGSLFRVGLGGSVPLKLEGTTHWSRV